MRFTSTNAEAGHYPDPRLCRSTTLKDQAKPTSKYGVVVTIWNVWLVVYLLAAGIVARSASAALKVSQMALNELAFIEMSHVP